MANVFLVAQLLKPALAKSALQQENAPNVIPISQKIAMEYVSRMTILPEKVAGDMLVPILGWHVC